MTTATTGSYKEKALAMADELEKVIPQIRCRDTSGEVHKVLTDIEDIIDEVRNVEAKRKREALENDITYWRDLYRKVVWDTSTAYYNEFWGNFERDCIRKRKELEDSLNNA